MSFKQTNATKKPISTQRAQSPWLKQIITAVLTIVPCVRRDVKLPSSNIVTVHCIALVVKANPKVSGALPAQQSGDATAIMVFAHLFITESPNQNLVSSSTCNLYI